MPAPSEHKTVQARILQYAQEIGWTFVPRAEAEARRGFKAAGLTSGDRARGASLSFNDTLYAQVKKLNPRFAGSMGDITGRLHALKADIFGNREFLDYLRGRKTFYYKPENRELDLVLIDFSDPKNNVYEVTEEFYYHNGSYGNREDVVFLVNGIPVLVIECKNATKDEAIALGIDQLRRYHAETPELMLPQQIFTATEAIGFAYGVTWNTVRRNIFNWKDERIGQLEAKIKSFCAIDNVLAFLKDYIIFAEKDEELSKFIFRQHQKEAAECVVRRAHEPGRRGLVWNTQGSGKTFTMIKAAELLFKAPESNKPTLLLLIDRNELEDQMLRNLAALGLANVERATSIARLNELINSDYRGIIVTTIQKFRDMPANLNTRDNIYVLIDEAHRTTQGDLGNYLMAALPNATFIGFTGTPIDQTAYGKGTFKTFGADDAPQGYLHKYSISDSIADGTTLPLFYALAPSELLVPKEVLEQEFFKLAEAYGVADIDELNRILERAVNTRNFLKGRERIDKVAAYVAQHYRDNVEPLGYKAFLVGVDREACALYKEALDKYLPADWSEVVYTGSNNDSALLKRFHHDEKKEKDIRKQFAKQGTLPRILLVTEKLLTGYDAPVLYAMYLDKPMRDHTLLQAIARVNRPYENEALQMVKPHGFVLDFVGIFDKLEKALAFDSDEVNAIVKDIALLKTLFKSKMEAQAPQYLALIRRGFIDKDVDNLIEHFRDAERRKSFFKEYKEIEMLYEIISPDAFLRPYIDDYTTLSAIYSVVARAYTKRVYVDREFQKKTNELVQSRIDVSAITPVRTFIEIDEHTIARIKEGAEGENTKVINLVKSIEQYADENSDDPLLIGMADRAQQVQSRYESRQESTQEALDELLALLARNEQRKREQAEKGFDGLTYFVYRTLLDAKLGNAEAAAKKIKSAFVAHPNWTASEAEMRELRQQVTFAITPELDDLDQVAALVAQLFDLLAKAYKLDR